VDPAAEQLARPPAEAVELLQANLTVDLVSRPVAVLLAVGEFHPL